MRIAEIRLRPLALAFKEPYHWAGRVDCGAANLLVEVVTDEGITGYGEVIAVIDQHIWRRQVSRIANPTYRWRRITANPREPKLFP